MPEDAEEKNPITDEDTDSPRWIFLMLVAGLVLVFAGALVVFAATASGGSGSSSSGVVIFIGPIPIVFGSGPYSALLILAGAILAAVSIAIFVIMRRKR